MPDVCNPPNRIVGVVGNEQRSVMGDRYPYWAAPHMAVINNEPCEKVVVTAGRQAMAQVYPDHLAPGATSSVPGTVEG